MTLPLRGLFAALDGDLPVFRHRDPLAVHAHAAHLRTTSRWIPMVSMDALDSMDSVESVDSTDAIDVVNSID